jgi:hypothetical protein
MNMHGIVRGVVTAVNPDITVTVKQSTGYTTSADGTQVPAYSTTTGVRAQIQALSGKDLHQIDGLNLQGSLCAIYLYGSISGVVRANQQGGDLITVSSGAYAGVWLVTVTLEQWSDGGPASWCKVCGTLQNGA